MSTNRRQRVSVPSTKMPSSTADPVMGELLGVESPPPAEPAASAAPAQQPAKISSTSRPRMTVYISEEVQEALRAAVYWTNNQPEGYSNLSDLLEEAGLEKVRELERKYNGGEPFTPMPQGKRLRRGRPIGT
jgi:hypothetical protein